MAGCQGLGFDRREARRETTPRAAGPADFPRLAVRSGGAVSGVHSALSSPLALATLLISPFHLATQGLPVGDDYKRHSGFGIVFRRGAVPLS